MEEVNRKLEDSKAKILKSIEDLKKKIELDKITIMESELNEMIKRKQSRLREIEQTKKKISSYKHNVEVLETYLNEYSEEVVSLEKGMSEIKQLLDI